MTFPIRPNAGDKSALCYEAKVESVSGSECRRVKERIRSASVPRVGIVSLTERPECEVDEALGPEEQFTLVKEIQERAGFDMGVN
ncbi:MAG: hypothetical protein ACP5HQ_03440 [Thermoprotei archaeon]